jgi:hypothetical protein
MKRIEFSKLGSSGYVVANFAQLEKVIFMLKDLGYSDIKII